MLFTSQYILTECCFDPKSRLKIYPWIHNSTNKLSIETMNRAVTFPDVDPTKFGHKMSMYAGDFLEIFKKENDFRCVASSFFLDTGRNALEYIEKIFYILKPGGIWVNNGPLLYHYANESKCSKKYQVKDQTGEYYKSEGSVEFSLAEIFSICKKVGFILEAEREIEVFYNKDVKNLVGYQFKSQFWTMRKPL